MKRRALPILVSVAGACLVGLLIYGVAARSASRTLDEQVAEARWPPAPQAAHALAMLDSRTTASLASFKGRVVVLNFWASWCEPCQVEAPLLQRSQSQLARDGGTVLGVSYLDASPDSLSFVRRYRLTYPNLRDDDGVFARSYGTDKLPESFIIDRSGRVVAISRGEIGRPFLSRAIALARGS